MSEESDPLADTLTAPDRSARTGAKLFGQPFTEVTVGGVAYPLRQMTVAEQMRYAVWLERRAWEALDRSAEYKTPAADRHDRRELRIDIGAGVYSPGGEAYKRSVFTQAGQAMSLFVPLSADYPELDYEDVEAEVAGYLDRLAAEAYEMETARLRAEAERDDAARRALLGRLAAEVKAELKRELLAALAAEVNPCPKAPGSSGDRAGSPGGATCSPCSSTSPTAATPTPSAGGT